MAKSIPARVRPEILRWARESAGLEVLQAAKRAQISSETVKAWESGDGRPSISQLRKLGRAYGRPIAVFFLPQAPEGFSVQREFRRLQGTASGQESPALRAALRWAIFRREAAREILQLVGSPAEPMSHALSPSAPPEDAGEFIRGLLGVTWEQQMGWQSAHKALGSWRTAAEEHGVLVFQASGVDLDEMRATCVPDQPLPLILLNARDAPHARVFSVLHEFAHILFDAAGHRTSRMEGERSPEEQPLEVAANAAAAAALLPARPFLALVGTESGAADGDDEALKRLASKAKLSPEVVLRRLVTLGHAREAVYREKRSTWQRNWYVPSPGGGGPSVEIKTIAGDGRGYTQLVLSAYEQRVISSSAASDYLGVKPRHFQSIRRELALPFA